MTSQDLQARTKHFWGVIDVISVLQRNDTLMDSEVTSILTPLFNELSSAVPDSQILLLKHGWRNNNFESAIDLDAFVTELLSQMLPIEHDELLPPVIGANANDIPLGPSGSSSIRRGSIRRGHAKLNNLQPIQDW